MVNALPVLSKLFCHISYLYLRDPKGSSYKFTPSFENTSNQLPIFIELYTESINYKNSRTYVLESYNNFINFFSELLKNGMDKGFIKKADPLKVSKIIFSITLGLLIQGLIDPQSENWPGMAKESIRLLLT